MQDARGEGWVLIAALVQIVEIVMQKLFAATELENNIDCNFNILVDGAPRLLGGRKGRHLLL